MSLCEKCQQVESHKSVGNLTLHIHEIKQIIFLLSFLFELYTLNYRYINTSQLVAMFLGDMEVFYFNFILLLIECWSDK